MHWFLTCPHYSLSSFLPLQSSPAKPLIICPCPHSCPCFVSPVGPLHPLALISALVSCHLPVLFTHVRCPNFRPCVVTPPGPLHPLSVALISALVSLHLLVFFIPCPLTWFPPLCRYTSWSSSSPVRCPDFHPCDFHLLVLFVPCPLSWFPPLWLSPPSPLRPLSLPLISALETFHLVLFVPCPFPWFPPLTFHLVLFVPRPLPWFPLFCSFTSWSSSSPVPCPDYFPFVVSRQNLFIPCRHSPLVSFPCLISSILVLIPALASFPTSFSWFPALTPRFCVVSPIGSIQFQSLFSFRPLYRFSPCPFFHS